jgi:hypothetical protein
VLDSVWSEEARAMVRPFRTYREIVDDLEEPRDLRAAAFRVLLTLIFIGAFVSLTTAGRLVAFHVANTMVFWSFVPALQIAALALAVRVVSPRMPLAFSITLYFVGQGPWLLFLLLISGTCLFVPHVYPAMAWMLSHGVLFVLLLGTVGWGMLLTTAFFRAGLKLTRPRTALATIVFYLTFYSGIAGWYFVTNQLPPQLFGVP